MITDRALICDWCFKELDNDLDYVLHNGREYHFSCWYQMICQLKRKEAECEKTRRKILRPMFS